MSVAEKVAGTKAGSGSVAPARPAGGNSPAAKGHSPSANAAAPAKSVQTNAVPAEKPKGPVLAPEKRKALGRGLESLLGAVRGAPPVARPVPGSPSSETPNASVAGSPPPGGTPTTVAGSTGSTPPSSIQVPTSHGEPSGVTQSTGEAQPLSNVSHSAGASSGPDSSSGMGNDSATDASGAGWHTPAPGTFTGAANPTVPESGWTDGAAGIRIPDTLMAVDVSGESAAGIHGGAVVSDIQAQAARRAADGSVIVDLDVDLIDKNPYQTRHFTAEDDEELLALAESIKAQGLIQPITVRPGKDGRYILITGQRRTNATRLAGLATIAAVVRQVSDQQAAEMTVIENLMREDLNVMDQVRAFVMLSTTFQMTQSQIAGRIGSSRESVSNYMRLARLPEEVQGFLKNNELEYSHARLLLRLQDEGVILRVARKAAEEHMSVEALEDLVREKAYPVEGQEKKQGKARWVDPNVRAAQMSLERVLGMRVRIRDSRGKGKILIEYGSLEDFDRLVTVLGGKK